jgi:long-chain acyl-CoA synthetase
VGLPYDLVESRIDPDNGEIQMRSPALMLGYYKEEAATADAMTPDGWLRTGDKGKVDDRGYLSITGRVKDIFKSSKGKYVAPAPIEDLLIMHPDIEACAVAGANLTQPLGLVMLSQDAVARSADPEARRTLTESLAHHLESVNAKLEPHERMACLAVAITTWTPENGFVTPTLKIKRMRIEEAYASHYEEWLAQRKPVVWATH